MIHHNVSLVVVPHSVYPTGLHGLPYFRWDYKQIQARLDNVLYLQIRLGVPKPQFSVLFCSKAGKIAVPPHSGMPRQQYVALNTPV